MKDVDADVKIAAVTASLAADSEIIPVAAFSGSSFSSASVETTMTIVAAVSETETPAGLSLYCFCSAAETTAAAADLHLTEQDGTSARGHSLARLPVRFVLRSSGYSFFSSSFFFRHSRSIS